MNSPIHSKLYDRGFYRDPNRSSHFRYPCDAYSLRRFAQKREGFSILEIGVGRLEEPLTHLAAIYDGQQESLESVSMVLVDLKTREDLQEMLGLNETRQIKEPRSTHPDRDWYESRRNCLRDFSGALDKEGQIYTFKRELCDNLENTLSEPDTAQLSTKVEDFLDDNKDQYDIVCCNNVLPYLGVDTYPNPLLRDETGTDFARFGEVVQGIISLVRKKGILFMHIDDLELPVKYLQQSLPATGVTFNDFNKTRNKGILMRK